MAKVVLASFRQNAAPLALMLRSIAAEPERRRFHGPSPLRCVSKHEGPPSSSFETRARSLEFAGALAHARSSG
jgi:hypothetical protein